jgi:hypothetical protein
MANANEMTAQETKMQGILAAYLTSRKEEAPPSSHLDHDTLAAFTEGRLLERESAPVVSHLADCSFCWHITAELVRLDLQFADEPVEAISDSGSQPTKISAVLSGLFDKIFGGAENAVYAHEEKKDDEKSEEEKKED